jgi:glycosyltransferase involved in cell wall biosynthesis
MSQSVRTKPKVAVALATRNGERFLEAQLESLRNQTHERIDVWASDDGSTDGTVRLLEEARAGLWDGPPLLRSIG